MAPLDWGLGHATRTIPVIREFLSRGWTVDLAVSGSVSALYEKEFPGLRRIRIPGYAIRYPARGFEMPFWLLKNYRRIANVIRDEHLIAESLVKVNAYDAVFSDNRFGFYSSRAHSVYLTHQARIAFPSPFSIFEDLGVAWHSRKMSHFDSLWIPDFPEFPGLAGKLSHVSTNRVLEFVGPLSRFSGLELPSPPSDKKFRFAAILSGPEPMRTSFEKALLAAFEKIPGEHLLVRGLPGSSEIPFSPKNVTVYNHLDTVAFSKAIQNAESVVSRPGYSTVMDMIYLGADCIFVPTPGQTEQVYLGKALRDSGKASYLQQTEISAERLQSLARKKHSPWKWKVREDLLKSAVNRLAMKLEKIAQER